MSFIIVCVTVVILLYIYYSVFYTSITIIDNIYRKTINILNIAMNDIKINTKFSNQIKTIYNKLKSTEIITSFINNNDNETSYNINKGEQIILCLKSKKSGKFHDINTLMYVFIHEISHIGCANYEHDNSFYDLNLYLLNIAIKHNIYKFVNYELHPVEYCGMELNSNIL